MRRHSCSNAAMALAAAARRSLASRLFGRIHPALSHLLTAHSSGDATTSTPSPLHPPETRFGPPHFPIPQSSGTPAHFPFGIHLAGAGPSRRGFSTLPPYRVAEDAGAVLSDAAAASASFPSEVAWIAEDSSLSVKAAQHLIDAVHSFTGLNWWLSIAFSTVLIQSLWWAFPFCVRKQLPVFRQEMSAAWKLVASIKDENSLLKAQDRLLPFLKSLGPLVCISILKPYSFVTLYFAISNMVEKLPSLKEGGAFWFTDLTTPDALYIFPAMASLSLLLRLEFSLHYSKQERSLATHLLRALFVLTFPFAASFPKAICCYYIAWSFASLAQTIVFNQPAVKKLLFIMPNSPTCSSSKGPTGPTADDSPHTVDESEQPLPPERGEASDSSVDQAKDQSDKKSEKDN